MPTRIIPDEPPAPTPEPAAPDRASPDSGFWKPESRVTADTPWRHTGNTDRASFRGALARSLTPGEEPPPYAEADAIYAVIAPHGLTRLAAALAWTERSNDTNRTYHQPPFYGPERRNLWAVKGPGGGWAHYASYTAAAKDWIRLVTGPVFATTTTLEELMLRYAPPSDRNSASYWALVADQINALPLVADTEPEPGPQPEPEPPWSPVIYDLARNVDAARFGLNPPQADAILAKRIPHRNGQRPEAIVLHVQWGTTRGSLQHWLGVSASSTVMVQRDGSLLRVIPEAHGPWTNGDVRMSDGRALGLISRFGPDPNVWSLTIEAEDERTERITDLQARTILWQIRQWQAAYPWLAGGDWAERILGHYEINSVDRARCGVYRDRIVSQLAADVPEPLPEPEPAFAGLPPWLPPEYFITAFPLADPAGTVTPAIIAWAVETGRVPWFLERVAVDARRALWKFDGVTLLSEGKTVWREGGVS